MKAYAFIPARSGSKGLPHKNIKPIDGHPLLAYAVAFGKALGVDQVIVSTDSPEYKEIAESYGAFCPGLRSPEASGDTSMEEEIIADLTQKLPALGIDLPDVWIRLKPTNPFRKPDTVRRALTLLEEDDCIDSVRIVSKADCRLVVQNDEGFLEPILPDIWDPNRSVMRRTEFPEAYSPFNLDLLRHRNWERWGSGYMGKRIMPIVDHAITGMDINDGEDFELVKTMIEVRPRPQVVADYLVDPS
ncbi:cytidylyltransferase domain-containing protein [Aliiroseovarius sp.]|uniref:acylneuraminate cytidylyltransferase family protein n=1 Tax=Aliiroseovarius sp. TaxID=1872442 RepID=UPI003BA9E907